LLVQTLTNVNKLPYCKVLPTYLFSNTLWDDLGSKLTKLYWQHLWYICNYHTNYILKQNGWLKKQLFMISACYKLRLPIFFNLEHSFDCEHKQAK